MDFFDAVKGRYSYRGEFVHQPIPEDNLRRIVQAALDAPSGCNFQTTEFVIVTDRDRVQRLAHIVARESMASAPAVIVALCHTGMELKGLTFWMEDCAAAVETALLAVTALGYASCWIDGALRREGRAERIGELLGVPADRAVRVLLPVGKPAEKAERKEKKPFAERAWFQRYGG